MYLETYKGYKIYSKNLAKYKIYFFDVRNLSDDLKASTIRKLKLDKLKKEIDFYVETKQENIE